MNISEKVYSLIPIDLWTKNRNLVPTPVSFHTPKVDNLNMLGFGHIPLFWTISTRILLGVCPSQIPLIALLVCSNNVGSNRNTVFFTGNSFPA